MVDISLDLNPLSSTYKDVLILNNSLVLTSDADPNGSDPVVQDIIQRMQWILGEWFLYLPGGIPWFQQILIKNPDQDKVDALLLASIKTTPGVLTITSYSFVWNSTPRSLNVNFRAQKSTGTISYAGIVNF